MYDPWILWLFKVERLTPFLRKGNYNDSWDWFCSFFPPEMMIHIYVLYLEPVCQALVPVIVTLTIQGTVQMSGFLWSLLIVMSFCLLYLPRSLMEFTRLDLNILSHFLELCLTFYKTEILFNSCIPSESVGIGGMNKNRLMKWKVQWSLDLKIFACFGISDCISWFW